MITIKNKYIGNLRTEAVHLKSGNIVITDAPTDNNGKGEAFSPSDLVCAALASCMLTIMGIVADREKINISGLASAVEKIMSLESPRKIVEINISFDMPNEILISDKQKEVLKRAALTCPVALSLNTEIKQNVIFNF